MTNPTETPRDHSCGAGRYSHPGQDCAAPRPAVPSPDTETVAREERERICSDLFAAVENAGGYSTSAQGYAITDLLIRYGIRHRRYLPDREADPRPCDGGCSVEAGGPQEDCSRHGRPVAEVWAALSLVQQREADLRATVERLRGVLRATVEREHETAARMVDRIVERDEARRALADLREKAQRVRNSADLALERGHGAIGARSTLYLLDDDTTAGPTPSSETTVAAIDRLLGVCIWDAPSFRADIRIDFHEDGSVLAARLLNPEPSSETGREQCAAESYEHCLCPDGPKSHRPTPEPGTTERSAT